MALLGRSVRVQLRERPDHTGKFVPPAAVPVAAGVDELTADMLGLRSVSSAASVAVAFCFCLHSVGGLTVVWFEEERVYSMRTPCWFARAGHTGNCSWWMLEPGELGLTAPEQCNTGPVELFAADSSAQLAEAVGKFGFLVWQKDNC